MYLTESKTEFGKYEKFSTKIPLPETFKVSLISRPNAILIFCTRAMTSTQFSPYDPLGRMRSLGIRLLQYHFPNEVKCAKSMEKVIAVMQKIDHNISGLF